MVLFRNIEGLTSDPGAEVIQVRCTSQVKSNASQKYFKSGALLCREAAWCFYSTLSFFSLNLPCWKAYRKWLFECATIGKFKRRMLCRKLKYLSLRHLLSLPLCLEPLLENGAWVINIRQASLINNFNKKHILSMWIFENTWERTT